MLCLLFALSLGASSASAACPNAVFRSGPSAKLPDCRAYELVTPRYTAGIATEGNLSDGEHLFLNQLVNAAGDSVSFETVGGALPGFPGTGVFDRYRSVRTANGWVTKRDGLYSGEAESVSFGGVSPGGEYSIEKASGGIMPSLWAPWAGHDSGVFLRGPTGVEPLARGILGDDPTANSFSDGMRGKFISEHGTHVMFESRQKLEPEAPEKGIQAIYDRTPGGPTHVVSLLPNGEPVGENVEFLQSTPDGSEVAFDGGGCGNGCNFTNEGSAPLWVRRNNNEPSNAETVEVLRPNGVALNRELHCLGGPTSGATLEYQWLRDGVAIPGATTPDYTVSSADEGHALQCQVTASNSEGTMIATTDNRVVAPFEGKHFPEMAFVYLTPNSSETYPAGQTFTCHPASSNGHPVPGPGETLSYQWLRDGTEISGATESTYTPTAGDIGGSIQCRVTLTNSDGMAVGYSWNPIRIVPAIPQATANPAISDATTPGSSEPAVGDELTCSNGTWTGSPTFSYEWLRGGTPIVGATENHYLVEAADEGKGLQCAVTATNAAGSTQAISNWIVPAIPPSGPLKNHFLEVFGSAEQPSFEHPQGLALDQTGGDLYVIDAWAYPHTVSRWHPDGTPDDFAEQSNTVKNNKLKYVLGESVGPNESEVAVDSSGGATDGNIYITNTQEHLVEIFSSSGASLGQLTAAGASAFGEVCGVAVDSSGTVYVGDYSGQVHKFVPSGAAPVNADNTANFTYSNACQVAAGAGPTAGYIFVDSYGGELVKMDSTTGEVKYTVATGVTTATVDPISGYLYALMSSEFKGFDASGAASATAVSRGKLESGQGIAVSGATHDVYVTTPWSTSTVSVYGPAAQSGPEPPELESPPTVSGTAAVGHTLYCNTGSWNNAPSGYTRQWLRNGEEIAGATGYSYELTGADVNKVIQCRIIATNDEGSTAAVNANEGATYAVAGLPPAATARIQYNGYAGVGYTFDGLYNGKVFWDDSRTNFPYNFTGGFAETPGNLFTVDLNDEEVTPIATTGDAQFIRVSEDGSHAFFTSPSRYNDEGIEGKPNVYVWSRSNDSVKYIATVRQFDIESYGGDGSPGLTNLALGIADPGPAWGPGSDHSRTNPDGSVFAFETTARLTSFDNREAAAKDCHERPVAKELCTEIYVYETATGNLECVSCGPGTGPATGEARLETFGGGLGSTLLNFSGWVPSLTNNGEELMFESTEDLVTRDRNGAKDVYRWKKGQGLALISTGHNLGDSTLYAMTPEGGDVIFGTHQALVPEDENGATTRLYDAKVDGGFPPPESSVTEPCSNDVCQGAPSAAPEEPQLSSSSINGRGNASGKLRCGKGLRRVVRHGKETCVRRKHHRPAGRRHRRSHHHSKHRPGSGRRAAL